MSAWEEPSTVARIGLVISTNRGRESLKVKKIFSSLMNNDILVS